MKKRAEDYTTEELEGFLCEVQTYVSENWGNMSTETYNDCANDMMIIVAVLGERYRVQHLLDSPNVIVLH